MSRRFRDWLRRASTEEPDASSLSPSQKPALLQLRRDVSVLRMERAILKKAAAFFAKESR